MRAVLPRTLTSAPAPSRRPSRPRTSKNQLGFLRTFLLIFAYVALFVGAFIIFNTFSITVAQRTREFGLLRTLGATRAQIMRSVVARACCSASAARSLGLLGGIGARPGARRSCSRRSAPTCPTAAPCSSSARSVVSLLAGTASRWSPACCPGVARRRACRRSRRCARASRSRRRRCRRRRSADRCAVVVGADRRAGRLGARLGHGVVPVLVIWRSLVAVRLSSAARAGATPPGATASSRRSRTLLGVARQLARHHRAAGAREHDAPARAHARRPPPR